MNINNTGTFYVEGEYAQGDTILTAGDWELRANGSKNAFAYSPETFVRRNLLNWSEDFGHAPWTRSASTLDNNVIASPDRSLTGYKLIANNDSTNHYLVQNKTVTGGEVFTFSCFAKKGEYDFIILALTEVGVSTNTTWFDLSAGTVGQNANGNTATITSVGDGWHHCVLTRPMSLGQTTAAARLYIGNVDGTSIFSGDGTSGIYIWGAQLEQAATPSDYQRTTTHVPRPFAIKDELVTNGTFDTDLSGWNLVGNGSAAVVSGELQVTFGTSGPTTVGQAIQVDVGKSYEISWRAREVSGSGGLMRVTGGVDLAVPIGSTTDVEFSYIVNPTSNFTLFCRKDSAGTSAFDNISVKEVQQPLTLGNGNHKDLRYYPKTLSQNEIEALTA